MKLSLTCPILDTLVLNNCPLVSDNGLENFIETAKNLTTLQITSCTRLTSKGLQTISKCSKLKSLSLIGLDRLRDDTLIELNKQLRELTEIGFMHCERVYDYSKLQFLKGND